MASLVFYGGVGEIGGNKILVQDEDTRLLLDFGMSFGERRKFYSEPWLTPRSERELLEFGIIPPIEGIYHFDNRQPSVDAVFLSHPHADHSMYVSFIKREIPVHCGETTNTILRALSDMRRRDFETDISGLKFKTFRTGDSIRVGNLDIEPCHVDHSTPGAYGFVIHTSEGAVVYTGDFRMHGTRPAMTGDFVEAAAKAKPIAMLTEGTNMMEADVSSESEVKSKVAAVVRGSAQIVLADFSYIDIDRLRTFHNIAVETGRRLAISLRQAYLLRRLSSDRKLRIPNIDGDEQVAIYQRSKKTYRKWERELLDVENVTTASEIRGEQAKTILACSFSDVKELVEIRPKPGSNFILSMSEPFNEEREIEFDKFKNWLDHFGLPMYRIHCSGHIMPNQLRRIISRIRPKRVFPIHTEYPVHFAKFMHDTARVELPILGCQHQLGKNRKRHDGEQHQQPPRFPENL